MTYDELISQREHAYQDGIALALAAIVSPVESLANNAFRSARTAPFAGFNRDEVSRVAKALREAADTLDAALARNVVKIGEAA